MHYHWKITLPIFLACIAVLVGASFFLQGTPTSPGGNASSSASSSPFLPAREESVALISRTMNDFADALLSKDFEKFYATFSSAWKKQTTAEDVAAAMGQFTPFGREVKKSVGNSEPYLNAPPVIDAHSVLTLKGFYRIEGTKMMFSLQYIREGGAWKLFGVDLQVK